ncbi:unnamed protein product [Dibothriocephalus latus]|uniref:Uncharacterized protein n=1 Tax=Dibothriocephalus latus TaxID=60516 RepID=A0A3P7REU1_DIBLA|nr:unnamed protein product [Dibothriocephalus latus]
MDFEKLGGIRAVAWLVETQQALENTSNLTASSSERLNMVLENSSAILCNLSIVEAMRQPLLRDAVLPSLVEAVLDPTASASFNAFRSHSDPLEGQPCYNSIFFRNICALIRCALFISSD